MDGPKFKFYVLNSDFNNQKIVHYNIFNNSIVYKRTLKAVKKYCRAPKKFVYIKYRHDGDEYIYGFEGFCRELKSIIMCEEWGRCQYEIVVGDMFACAVYRDDETLNGKNVDEQLELLKKQNAQLKGMIKNLEKWDCYKQIEPNIEIIARDVIYTYKQWQKEEKQKKELKGLPTEFFKNLETQENAVTDNETNGFNFSQDVLDGNKEIKVTLKNKEQ